MGKNLFSTSPPQATPRDLLSRIARALRRCFGSSGRFFGVPRHCAGRVARRRPGESQRQCGNSAGDVGHRNQNTWWTMGTHLPTDFSWFWGPKRASHNARKDLSLAMIVGCAKIPSYVQRGTIHAKFEWNVRKRHSCCQIVPGSGEIVTRLAKFREIMTLHKYLVDFPLLIMLPSFWVIFSPSQLGVSGHIWLGSFPTNRISLAFRWSFPQKKILQIIPKSGNVLTQLEVTFPIFKRGQA